MQLIGAGLPRTATLSQKIALEMLGLRPCYHMVDVLADLGRARRWTELLEGGGGWDEVFAGYEATVDWPGAFFYRELIEVYPDAKVLLSVRDGAAWERSMLDTIWGVLYGDSLMRDLSSARARVDAAWRDYLELMERMWQKSGLLGCEDGSGTGSMARAMERYNAEVRASVPADRLLVWSVADGWAPLCEFLEVPVPDSPFPRVNDSAAFADRIIDSSLALLCDWRLPDGRAAASA